MNNPQGFPQIPMGGNNNKNQNNILNHKTKKCKNFEKDGTCKYGAHCTFAHGDRELRNKQANLQQMNNNPMMMPVGYGLEGIPFMIPQGIDMNQMQLMMPSPGNLGSNPYMMNMMGPPMEGMNNNENNGPKEENKPQ